MTFAFQRWCAPGKRFSHEGEHELLYEQDGALLVALVSRGRCGLPKGEATLMATAGSVVLAAGALHLAPVGACHIVGVPLLGEAAVDFAGALAEPRVLNGAACPGAAEAIARLGEELPAAEASALAYGLLCQLAGVEPDDAPLPELVAAAITEIREHYAEVYGIEELAASLGVSKSHLVRCFSAATGTSPGKYLAAVRIEAAKRLLAGSSHPLDVVATLCGFSGANYLCKVFKKATGETPAAWRANAAPRRAPSEKHELEEMLYL